MTICSSCSRQIPRLKACSKLKAPPDSSSSRSRAQQDSRCFKTSRLKTWRLARDRRPSGRFKLLKTSVGCCSRFKTSFKTFQDSRRLKTAAPQVRPQDFQSQELKSMPRDIDGKLLRSKTPQGSSSSPRFQDVTTPGLCDIV